jgi:hypothetical protein
MRAGLPVEAHDVAIDTLTVRDDERHLLAAIESPEYSEGIPVVPIEALVYLKLVSPRAKDRLDLLELAQHGIDLERARSYLERNAPLLVAKLDEIARSAASDPD